MFCNSSPTRWTTVGAFVILLTKVTRTWILWAAMATTLIALAGSIFSHLNRARNEGYVEVICRFQLHVIEDTNAFGRRETHSIVMHKGGQISDL